MWYVYEPLESDGRYLWYNRDHPLTGGGDYAGYLPESVFRKLRVYMPSNKMATSYVKAYASKQSAMDALEDALQRSK